MVNRAFRICAYDPEMRAGTGASARDEPDFKRAAVDMARGQRRRWRFSARCFGSKRARAGARREGVAVGDAEGALAHHEFMTRTGGAARTDRAARRSRIATSSIVRAAQIAEAQAYKHELGLIYAAVERTRNEMTALGVDAPRAPSRPRVRAASLRPSSAAPNGRRSRSCRRPRRSIRPPTRCRRRSRAATTGTGQRHPGPRGADFRGLQFPGPHRPARRQGG